MHTSLSLSVSLRPRQWRQVNRMVRRTIEKKNVIRHLWRNEFFPAERLIRPSEKGGICSLRRVCGCARGRCSFSMLLFLCDSVTAAFLRSPPYYADPSYKTRTICIILREIWARVHRHIVWMLCDKSDEFLLACAAVFVNLKCIPIPAPHCLLTNILTLNLILQGWSSLLIFSHSLAFLYLFPLLPFSDPCLRILWSFKSRLSESRSSSNRPYLFNNQSYGHAHEDKILFSI